MYCDWRLDHAGCCKIKLKNGLNSKKWSTAGGKLFEMFLKTIDWKLILKFCVIYTFICGLHFNRTNIENKLWKIRWKILWSVIP